MSEVGQREMGEVLAVSDVAQFLMRPPKGGTRWVGYNKKEMEQAIQNLLQVCQQMLAPKGGSTNGD